VSFSIPCSGCDLLASEVFHLVGHTTMLFGLLIHRHVIQSEINKNKKMQAKIGI